MDEGMTSEKIADEHNKTKVTEAEIIVRGKVDKPYFGIRYHEVGKSYDSIGFGSYVLENVFKWKDEYLEIVEEEE